MTTSTRTPEGEPNKCPVCGEKVRLEPSRPPGDAPCPRCGTLLWFPAEPWGPILTVWEYGIQLIEQGDIATGLKMLQADVSHKPYDVERRRVLRAIERKKRGKRGLITMSDSAALDEASWEIRHAKHKRADQFIEWDEIDRAAERALAIDPWNVDFHVELGRACQARGYNELARFAYQCALEIAPERTDLREALEGLPTQ